MIRHAEEKDYHKVFSMYFEKGKNRFLYFDRKSDEEFRKYWESMLKRRHSYVVDVRGDVRGFISAVRRIGQEKHVVHVGPVVVARGWTGRGVGRQLMNFLLNKFKYNSKVKRVELVVNSDNARGVKFFRKFGFEIEAVLKKDTERDGKYIDDFMMVLLFD